VAVGDADTSSRRETQGDHRQARVKRSNNAYGPQVCAARRVIRSGQCPGTELATLVARTLTLGPSFADDYRSQGPLQTTQTWI
jgi:hypothetical protein